ncbi:unnamed protein product [Closterium sp. Naga37s-1]|nr:unnamed protein product [Closterium sp. Naga37s-1]
MPASRLLASRAPSVLADLTAMMQIHDALAAAAALNLYPNSAALFPHGFGVGVGERGVSSSSRCGCHQQLNCRARRHARLLAARTRKAVIARAAIRSASPPPSSPSASAGRAHAAIAAGATATVEAQSATSANLPTVAIPTILPRGIEQDKGEGNSAIINDMLAGGSGKSAAGLAESAARGEGKAASQEVVASVTGERAEGAGRTATTATATATATAMVSTMRRKRTTGAVVLHAADGERREGGGEEREDGVRAAGMGKTRDAHHCLLCFVPSVPQPYAPLCLVAPHFSTQTSPLSPSPRHAHSSPPSFSHQSSAMAAPAAASAHAEQNSSGAPREGGEVPPRGGAAEVRADAGVVAFVTACTSEFSREVPDALIEEIVGLPLRLTPVDHVAKWVAISAHHTVAAINHVIDLPASALHQGSLPSLPHVLGLGKPLLPSAPSSSPSTAPPVVAPTAPFQGGQPTPPPPVPVSAATALPAHCAPPSPAASIAVTAITGVVLAGLVQFLASLAGLVGRVPGGSSGVGQSRLLWNLPAVTVLLLVAAVKVWAAWWHQHRGQQVVAAVEAK